MNDLRAPIVEGPAASGERRPGDGDGPVRPRRTEERGPIGFGAVMRDVKGARAGSRRDGGGNVRAAVGAGGVDLGAQRRGTGAPGGGEAPGSATGATEAPAASTTPTAGAPTTPQQPQGATDAAMRERRGDAARELGTARSTTGAEGRAAQPEARVGEVEELHRLRESERGERPRSLGRMRVQEAMRRVLDEALKLEIRESMREVRIELEPEHLGPMIVRLRRDGDRVDVAFRVREARAAQAIGAETHELAERLREAGLADPHITLDEDASLQLGDA